MRPQKKRLIYKITVLGENFETRTQIRLKYLTEDSGQYYSSSLGTDFSVRLNSFQEYEIVSQIWDIKPNKKYQTLRENYYTGTCGIIITFNQDDNNSFLKIPYWINDIYSNPHITQVKLPILIIGIKNSFLTDQIPNEKIEEYIKQLSEWLSLEVNYLIIDIKGDKIFYPENKSFEVIYNKFLFQIIQIRESKLVPRKNPPKPQINDKVRK